MASLLDTVIIQRAKENLELWLEMLLASTDKEESEKLQRYIVECTDVIVKYKHK